MQVWTRYGSRSLAPTTCLAAYSDGGYAFGWRSRLAMRLLSLSKALSLILLTRLEWRASKAASSTVFEEPLYRGSLRRLRQILEQESGTCERRLFLHVSAEVLTETLTRDGQAF
jgi:hypothetical protein